MSEEHWNKTIDKITEKFFYSFGLLTKSQLNFKPDQDTWSIAQNIAHLILLNNSYFQHFDEIKKGTHTLLHIDSIEQFVNDSLQALRPFTREDKPKTANTWPIWQPSQEIFDLGILTDFMNSQSAFKVHIRELGTFLLEPTFIKYPGETSLVFKLEDCIDFLIEHERRHLAQANAVKQILTQG